MPRKIDFSDLANLEISQVVSQWREQRDYVIINQDSLRKQYGTDYLAVKDRRVVDHDKDEFALAKRMEVRFRKKFVLISTLEMILNPPVDHLLSPECESDD